MVLSAIVDEEGTVKDLHVVTSFHRDFDRIAMNALRKSPKWTPAMQHNRKVKYRFIQAVVFTQEEY